MAPQENFDMVCKEMTEATVKTGKNWPWGFSYKYLYLSFHDLCLNLATGMLGVYMGPLFDKARKYVALIHTRLTIC